MKTTVDRESNSHLSLCQDSASSGGALQTGHIAEIYGSHSREESRSGVSRRELRVGGKGLRQAREERLGRRAWGDRLGMKLRKKGRGVELRT